MPRAPKACLVCGRRTSGGSRCDVHQAREDARQQARQWYRAVYGTGVYQSNRRIRMAKAGGQCERVIQDVRCIARAVECHHTMPLSTARSLDEALAFSRWELLEAVCARHHPGAHGNR
jgi:hypothetical protein